MVQCLGWIGRWGERRARAAIMILLALPGSTYIYQGDELGLHEVADLPPEILEDPMASRSTKDKGRDRCRVPLPWTPDGLSHGFGVEGAHLPQPDWFGSYAISVQEADPNPRSIFTAKRSRSAASCLLAATSAGSSRSRMCWASSEPVAYGA
jgi:glycosidase